jgi:DNA-binding CsgD family transcriptional regulator
MRARVRPEYASLLVTLIHAARVGAQPERLLVEAIERNGRRGYVVRLRARVPALAILSPAECAVLRLRAAGHSYSAIAQQRTTSYRTVANQIAAASRRLGVSERFDLLWLMACSSLGQLGG